MNKVILEKIEFNEEKYDYNFEILIISGNEVYISRGSCMARNQIVHMVKLFETSLPEEISRYYNIEKLDGFQARVYTSKYKNTNVEDTLVFIDTETSGLDAQDKVLQLAYSYKTQNGIRSAYEVMTDPGVAIDPMAAVITGIKDSDVKGKEVLSETLDFKKLQRVLDYDNTYFVAYNAPFDVDMLERDGLKINRDRVIDLYKIVKQLFKDAYITNRAGEEVPLDNHKLQYLRIILKLDEREDFEKLLLEYGMRELQPHTALSDIIVLEALFYYVMERFDLTLEDMIELNNNFVLEEYITYGMIFEKGTPYKEILVSSYEQNGILKMGYEYLDWCIDNMEMAMDTKNSIKFFFYKALLDDEIPVLKQFLKYVEYGLENETNIRKLKKLEKMKEELSE